MDAGCVLDWTSTGTNEWRIVKNARNIDVYGAAKLGFISLEHGIAHLK